MISVDLSDSSLFEELSAAVLNLRISGNSDTWLRQDWFDPSMEPEIEAAWPQRLEVRRMVLRKLDEGCKVPNHRLLSSAC